MLKHRCTTHCGVRAFICTTEQGIVKIWSTQDDEVKSIIIVMYVQLDQISKLDVVDLHRHYIYKSNGVL